jgi:hypothetical protein
VGLVGTLWRQGPGDDWQPRPIREANLVEARALGIPGVRFLRFQNGAAGGGMALLVQSGVQVRVNGEPVPAGLRILDHQDEVVSGRARLFYSAEATPLVTAFRLPEGGRSPTCPLCRRAIKDGELAVQCPGCGRFFHELAHKHCWTYFPACSLCRHPTALSGEPIWRPEMEETYG